MPIDIQNLTFDRTGQVTLAIPKVVASFKVVDSQTGQARAGGDFSGAAQLVWPNVVSTLTAAEKTELFDFVIQKVMEIKMRGIA